MVLRVDVLPVRLQLGRGQRGGGGGQEIKEKKKDRCILVKMLQYLVKKYSEIIVKDFTILLCYLIQVTHETVLVFYVYVTKGDRLYAQTATANQLLTTINVGPLN
jgi:hypothetical protein